MPKRKGRTPTGKSKISSQKLNGEISVAASFREVMLAETFLWRIYQVSKEASRLFAFAALNNLANE
jgi:hypothetical protein